MLLGFGLQPAFAQDSDAVTVDVGRCTGLESADERLACFAQQVDAVLKERGRAGVGEAAAVPDSVVDADRAASRRDEKPVQEAREDEYSGTIVAIRERLPGAYVITLDNGQVWEQTEPKQYPLRPGLQVRIYPTGWGSYYRLSGLGTGRHIQVRKVQ